MTVAQLITLLQQQPQDSIILIDTVQDGLSDIHGVYTGNDGITVMDIV